jgi:hypothetical protein
VLDEVSAAILGGEAAENVKITGAVFSSGSFYGWA